MFFIQTGEICPGQRPCSCRASLRLQPPVLVPTHSLKSSFPAGLTSKEKQLGKEAIWIQSTEDYVYVHTSLPAPTNPYDSWDHVPLPFLLLIWKKKEKESEIDRYMHTMCGKEFSTYLPYLNLCVEEKEAPRILP